MFAGKTDLSTVRRTTNFNISRILVVSAGALLTGTSLLQTFLEIQNVLRLSEFASVESACN
jgi:hypothetical protein